MKQATGACETMGGKSIGDVQNLEPYGITSISLDQEKTALDPSQSVWVFQFNKNLRVGTGNELSSLFINGNGSETVLVNFCIKFGLNDNGVTKTFREYAVLATLHFENIFSQNGLQTAANDVQTFTYSVSYSLYGKICGWPVPNVFKTGEIIPVCICTDDYPAVHISKITELKFSTEQFSQVSINGGNVNSLAFDNGCQHIVGTDSYCCHVDTILIANFYTPDGLDVTFSGMAELDHYNGQGKLRLTRNLEEQHVSSSFQGNIKTIATSTAGHIVSRFCLSRMAAAIGILFFLPS